MDIQDETSFPKDEKAVVVSCDMITAYGHGIDVCWDGIMSGRTAVADIERFSTWAFQSGSAAIVDGLKYLGDDSLVLQMFNEIFNRNSEVAPKDSALILASTKGEIDLLEKNLLSGEGDALGCNLDNLLQKVKRLAGINGEVIVVSAACASASAAIARAAAMIRSGQKDCVLVAACDSVTEFVYAGFSSLMALDKFPARPFDKSRSGLSLGEAAGFVLLMSASRAAKEGRKVLGEVRGWGLSDDANHMTGPSRTGDGLSLAITKALKSAGADEEDIGFISAHGTGTLYNDAMEIKSFKSVFNKDKPVYSIKGGLGHTMGAAGLVEMIIALRALKEKTVPPTVNFKDADDDAQGWASGSQRPVEENKCALLTNAGFSGINAALVLA
ncbi:MAG: beta-ketoacyl-[acyl-carrier-protein] synthase family protein [Nitrospirae bacterium]|nr:beta-ketoacyl-[acyl-carrier-protein] synthase family protein [Nitrospirota bacterium]